jgi:hypothetical protein
MGGGDYDEEEGEEARVKGDEEDEARVKGDKIRKEMSRLVVDASLAQVVVVKLVVCVHILV